MLLLDFLFEEHDQIRLDARSFKPPEPRHVEADLALEIEDLGLNVLNFALITEFLLDMGFEVVSK